MARVKQKARKPSGKETSTRAAQVAKDRNKHKVVVETTSKDEKKLRSVITFRADPPPGYTFIPAGNPELTAALKEFARREDQKIFAVTLAMSCQGKYIALAFIFQPALLLDGGKVIDESKEDKEDRLFAQVYQNQNGQRPPKEEKDQVTINTEAKQTIKDLFPKIPDNDLFQIIKTAFQLGDNKVGTAEEIPLVRRAQLSVVAHIRHCYTKYDKLLRQLPYNDARHAVEKETLARLIEWRGDDDAVDEKAQRAADDLLREVIVISDEEESESDDENAEQIAQDNVRIEELPSNAYDDGAARVALPYRDRRGELISQGHQIQSTGVRRYKPSDDMIAHRDRSRYAVWDQARRDYRSGANPPPATVLERVYEPIDVPTSRVLIPLDPPSLSSTQVVHSQPPMPAMSRIDYEPSPRTYIRDANGVLYERIDTRSYDSLPELVQRPLDRVPPSMMPPEPSRVRTRPSSPQVPSYEARRQGGEFDVGNGTIVQSIEGPDGAYLSSTSRQNPFQGQPVHRDTNVVHEPTRTYRDVPVVDLTNSDDQLSRKRRLEEVSGLPEYRSARRGSPGRHYERSYVPLSQPSSAYGSPRVVQYGEQGPSLRLRPAAPIVDTRRYVEHRPVHEAHDASNTSTAMRAQMDGAYDMRDPTRMQPRHVSHVQASRGLPGPDINMSRHAPENRPATALSRVYEPLPDSRGYDDRIMLDQPGTAREQYVHLPQDPHTRHVYASHPVAHESLPGALHPRAYDYHDAPATNVRPYAHVAR
ncbi:hypothetical protein LTR10_011486 [Elasticomyces elasticus]|uniref:DUF2293 domain-containing protein n=1 Tax=Exophiala sideris TaxID=1016849 RepID=A0ABR0JCW2_9EURO|nr:hypothetical protein LTR10_011486 [Elasticomyces elasticus]KAK5061680.1 hypothetical protein LTR69_004862 [Exophiala sideris]KAK5184380.1 hypothetical protein LTR44_003053 [Eurotiomycetes sp. CCFEE 6388]